MNSSGDIACLTESNGRSSVEDRTFEAEANQAISGGNAREFPMVMTVEQLCAYAQVCQDTVRMWINQKQDPLPHQRMSNSKYSHLRFRRDLFDEWQCRQMRAPARLAS